MSEETGDRWLPHRSRERRGMAVLLAVAAAPMIAGLLLYQYGPTVGFDRWTWIGIGGVGGAIGVATALLAMAREQELWQTTLVAWMVLWLPQPWNVFYEAGSAPFLIGLGMAVHVAAHVVWLPVLTLRFAGSGLNHWEFALGVLVATVLTGWAVWAIAAYNYGWPGAPPDRYAWMLRVSVFAFPGALMSIAAIKKRLQWETS